MQGAPSYSVERSERDGFVALLSKVSLLAQVYNNENVMSWQYTHWVTRCSREALHPSLVAGRGLTWWNVELR
jgi:hypothetical protein